MLKFERLKKALNAAPRWASQLTAGNIITFGAIVGVAWLAPHIEDGKTTASQAHRAQQALILTAAVMALTFIVRTVHDIRRHRMALILLANPEHFKEAMAAHPRFWLLFPYIPYGIHRINPKVYDTLTPDERYELAQRFLCYLATTDRRWWKPINLRRSARRGRIVALSYVVPVLALLVPFNLYRWVGNCPTLRKRR